MVAGPLEDRLAARSRPVTEAVFAAKLPGTLTVFATSAPKTTELADKPTRTMPYVEPVPASRTRSPPTDNASPAA